jgi:hypothetical protein
MHGLHLTCLAMTVSRHAKWGVCVHLEDSRGPYSRNILLIRGPYDRHSRHTDMYVWRRALPCRREYNNVTARPSFPLRKHSCDLGTRTPTMTDERSTARATASRTHGSGLWPASRPLGESGACRAHNEFSIRRHMAAAATPQCRAAQLAFQNQRPRRMAAAYAEARVARQRANQ